MEALLIPRGLFDAPPAQEEEQYEADEDADDYIPPDATENFCESCGEVICLGEDIVLIHVAQVFMDNAADLRYEPVLCDDGDPEIAPLFLKTECYENVQQEITEALIDVPPMEEPHAVISCDCCGSSIRMGEKLGLVKQGRIEMSPRLRNTTTFVTTLLEKGVELSPGLLCLTCTHHVGEALGLEDWDEISQNGECHHCMKSRCWRVGRCMCSCHMKRED